MSKRFSLGRLVATPGALAAMEKTGETPLSYLARHAAGDWGQVDQEDKQANDRAVMTGERILSSYKLKDGTKIWIITEGDRSSTCTLLPDEY